LTVLGWCWWGGRGGGEEGGRGKYKLNGVEEGVSWGDLVGFYILMKVQ